jgi:3-phosphoglycerate kinase
MNLPTVKNLSAANKKVLLRADYDVPLTSEGRVADETRVEESLSTIKYLLAQEAKIIIIAHLDRPGGKSVPGLSLKPVAARLRVMLPKVKAGFTREILGEKTKRMVSELKKGEILLLENLRFDPGEKANEPKFAKGLARLADYYVNEAFAVSHRKHASLVKIPSLLPSAFGLDFIQEVKVLVKLREKPKRPVVVILGGVKRSKIKAAQRLASWADYVLVGGELITYNGVPEMIDHTKILGDLNKDGEDITSGTIKRFKETIAKAATVVWSGPMGAFEDKKFEKGTRAVAEAVVASKAYKVVGGGDTEAALTRFGLVDKIDYVSSGGGAMLSFLAQGTLPGIEAIVKN